MVRVTYPKPVRYKETLVVGIEDKGCDPRNFQGGLRLCEPEEPWHAYMFACARDIESGKYTDEALELYHIGIRGVSFKFMFIQNEDHAFWHASQVREQIASTYEACARSGLQRIDEIIYFMDWKNITGAKEVEAAYQRLEMAKNSETVNLTLVPLSVIRGL